MDLEKEHVEIILKFAGCSDERASTIAGALWNGLAAWPGVGAVVAENARLRAEVKRMQAGEEYMNSQLVDSHRAHMEALGEAQRLRAQLAEAEKERNELRAHLEAIEHEDGVNR